VAHVIHPAVSGTGITARPCVIRTTSDPDHFIGDCDHLWVVAARSVAQRGAPASLKSCVGADIEIAQLRKEVRSRGETAEADYDDVPAMRPTPKVPDTSLRAGMPHPLCSRNDAQGTANTSRERVFVREVLEPRRPVRR
jgi:hypothetical protein